MSTHTLEHHACWKPATGKWLGLLAAAGIAALPAASHAAVTAVSNVTGYTIGTNAAGNKFITLSVNPAGTVEVVPFAPDVVRVRYHFGSLYDREEVAIARPFTNWPSFASTFTDASPTNFLIETDELLVEIVKSPKFQVHFKDKTGQDLLRDFQIEYDTDYYPVNDSTYDPGGGGASISQAPQGYKLKSIKVMPADEIYLGAGEYPAPINRRGRSVQFWNQDTFGWGEYRNPMYVSLPFFYGVRPAAGPRPTFAYGVFFHNPVRPYLKFQSGLGDTYSFEAGDDQLDYFFFGGGASHTLRNILNRYSDLTGRPCMLPKWAFGYHQSRHSYNSQQWVTDLAIDFRNRDFPCDAIYLDIGSQNDNYQLTLNANFTNVPGLVSFCASQGIQLVPLIEPCLKTSDPMYGEANGLLHFLKANNGSTYVGNTFLGNISWIDFSSTPAADWWIGKLTNYLANTGFEAIWNDLNEPNENNMPLNVLYWCDGRYGTGNSDTRRWHSNNKNTFSVLECAASYRAQQTLRPNRRPFVLSRAGWPGIQRYAVGWSGDNVSDFDALRFNTTLGVNVMISGQPWFGHDVGGFNGTPSAELLTRWIESGVLQPFYRNHTIDTSALQEPWVHAEPHPSWNRKWIKFRYEILPYLYSLAYQCSASGIPMNTPTAFHFMSDTNTFSFNDHDFMVGDSLLSSPVHNNGARTRTLYLPSGATWHFWPRDEAYAGGQWVTVPASLGVLPLFSRAGAIIPMGPAMNYANEFQPTWLDVHVWPGGTNAFELYEDDGLTTNYLAGAYARTLFTEETRSDGLTFGIGARAGSYDPGARSFYLVAHAAPWIQRVSLGATSLPRYRNRDELASPSQGWCYSTTDRRVIVKVPDTGSAATINIQYAVTDGDTDAMPDWWEVAHGLNPGANDASGNPDGDGRNNLQEYQANRDPQTADTFTSSYSSMAVAGTFNLWNEGARNMNLVSNKTWVLVADLAGSSKLEFKFVANDSWSSANWGESDQSAYAIPLGGTAEGGAYAQNIVASNLASRVYTFRFDEQTAAYSLTLSANVDSDGDGMSDGQEWSHGLNPYSRTDAVHDEDRDGANNYAETVAGTDLISAASYPYLRADRGTPPVQNVVLSWSSVLGRLYTVYYTTNDLSQPSWLPLVPFTNLSGSGILSVPGTNDGPRRFYRLGVSLP